MAINGLVVMTPSSIAYSGTSASVNADGSVDFSAVTSLSLNGVFTGDYDNYMIGIRHLGSSAGLGIRGRYRTASTDATGTNYTSQYLYASGTSVTALRTSSETGARMGGVDTAQRGGGTIYIFGPHLTQPTASRCVSNFPNVDASTLDDAATHSLNTSYDGLTLYVISGNFTGLLTVFGFNQ